MFRLERHDTVRASLPPARRGRRDRVTKAASQGDVSRRRVLRSFTATLTQILLSGSMRPLLVQAGEENPDAEERRFAAAGPFQTARLPRLEHTCVNCYPLCVGDRCLIRIHVTYPKGGEDQMPAPYPLAILSGGFLVKSTEYASYAERLASWGYVAVVYDKVENLMESLDDVVSMNVIRDIIDWAQRDPLMQKIADSEAVYLIGHSRGGKLSVLAASKEPRVRSLCLIDPVDNTIYAPLGPGYPSAVAELKARLVSIPMLAIGSELGADCAPIEANYSKFYDAAPGTAVEVVIRGTGHFQFLDHQSTLDRAICLQGTTGDEEVREITQSLMIAWGETTVKPSRLAAPYRRESTTLDGTSRRRRDLPLNQPQAKRPALLRQGSFASLLHSTAHILERTKNWPPSFSRL